MEDTKRVSFTNSIKTRLIAIMVALVIVPMFIAIIVSVVNTRKEGKKTANEINDAQAAVVESDISSIIADNLNALRGLAESPTIAQFIESGAEGDLEERVLSQMKEIDNRLADGNTSVVTGADGMQLLRAVGDLVDVSEREYFKQGMDGNTYVSDVNVSKTTGKGIITFVVPVWNRGDDKVVGIVQRNYDVSVLHDIIAEEVTEKRQEIVIVDRDGKVVAHSGHEVDPNEPEDQSGNPFYTDSRGDKLKGVYETKWDGDTWMVSWEKDPVTGWVIASCRVESVALSHVSKMTTLMVLIGIIFAIAGALVAVVFAKSIITTDCDGYSSNNNPNTSTLLTNNTSNKNSINTNDMNNKFANTHSFYTANSLSEFGSNNNTINNFSNSLKTKKSNNLIDKYNKSENIRNIINQNMNLIIGKNINNLYTYKNNEKNFFDSIKSSNNNEIYFTSEQKPLFYATNEQKESTLEKEKEKEQLKEDEMLCVKGEIARNHGKYYDAIDLFTKAIQLNPRSFKAFFNRAFTYDKIGLYNEAICDYTSTIDIRPNHSFCFYNRGITYNKLGDYKKSIYDFSKAIELEPNKPEFYFNRACLYKNIKNYQSAIEDYNIVIKLFPKLYTPIYNRGICYEKLKMHQNSIKDFETCIQMAKNNIHPYYHLATIYKNLEQYDTSIKYLKQLIDIKDDYSPAYHDIGVILTQFGKYETAIQYFNKSIELDNKKSIYYHNRGWAYRYINPKNAIEDITMAIKLDNKNPIFYFNRASIYKSEKMYDKAIEDYSFLILK